MVISNCQRYWGQYSCGMDLDDLISTQSDPNTRSKYSCVAKNHVLVTSPCRHPAFAASRA